MPAVTWVPPGHFYSPLVDVDELRQRAASVFDRSSEPVGVDLGIKRQLALLVELTQYRHLMKFPFEAEIPRRYFLNNPAFNAADAWALAAIIMHFRPRRLIEIGSGYSSALVADINELFLGGSLTVTHIDPFTTLLTSLLRPDDLTRNTIISSPIQEVSPSIVDELKEGDVLFIDSTHVAKAGSDVNFEIFQLLPRLVPGVMVHFHDVHYPFEYPEAWFFEENRSWNEAYILRALLTGNARYEIMLWNHYLTLHHQEALAAAMPPNHLNWGSSIWLRTRAEPQVS